jgi:hypothetical protein
MIWHMPGAGRFIHGPAVAVVMGVLTAFLATLLIFGSDRKSELVQVEVLADELQAPLSPPTPLRRPQSRANRDRRAA